MAEPTDPQRSSTSQPTSEKREKSRTRLVMLFAAVGALLVLVISAALNWPFGGGSGSDRGSSGQQGAAPAPAQVFTAKPGTCLNWTEPDAGDIRQVTCAEPHLFEVTDKADLRAEFPPTAPFPSSEQWQRLKQDRCGQVSATFLRGKFDPNGRFSVGAFTPSAEGWKAGDRALHCGLQQPGPSGKLYRSKGSVATQDQSDTYRVGQCLGINGTSVWDPVDCARPHSVEISGQVNLGQQFRGGAPSEGAQDAFLATKCAALTARYAGAPTAAKDKGLITYWDTLASESWAAGSRKVNCKLSAQLPDGSGLAPITGSVKGPVEVGKQPAPASPPPTEPGAPANGTR